MDSLVGRPHAQAERNEGAPFHIHANVAVPIDTFIRPDVHTCEFEYQFLPVIRRYIQPVVPVAVGHEARSAPELRP